MLKNNKIIAPIATVFALVMGMVSRMAGGAKPKLPLGLDQWIYGIPYGAITWFATTFVEWRDWIEYTVILLAYLGGVFSKRMGHGDWMNLPYSIKKLKKREWGDPILSLFFGRDPRHLTKSNATALADIKTYGEKKLYYRNLAGLAMSGIFPALIAAIPLTVAGFWIGGLAMIVGGAMKVVSYAVPWKIAPSGRFPWWVNHNSPNYEYKFFRDEFSEATQFGEYFTGFFGAIGIIIAYMDIVGVV
jgi:hypothetical protein